MKKTMVLLTILMCFASMNVFAQEVRGIETRRVKYDGPAYGYGWPTATNSSTKYYGWEFVNRNSCKVSVDITLYSHATLNGKGQAVKTQSIILNSGEKYIFKREEHPSTRVDDQPSDYPISNYYVEYKAFKLQ